MNNVITELYKHQKTIFTTKDLALLWSETDLDNLKAKVAYYVKKGALIRLRRGIFAKNKEYSPKELATSLYIPSYISFETALREAGITFQHYETIYIATSRSENITIDSHAFTYRKLKDELLYSPAGIINKDNYSIAGPERALLDTLYLFPAFYFDNLRSINWDTCLKLAPMYQNMQLINRVKDYQKKYAE